MLTKMLERGIFSASRMREMLAWSLYLQWRAPYCQQRHAVHHKPMQRMQNMDSRPCCVDTCAACFEPRGQPNVRGGATAGSQVDLRHCEQIERWVSSATRHKARGVEPVPIQQERVCIRLACTAYAVAQLGSTVVLFEWSNVVALPH